MAYKSWSFIYGLGATKYYQAAQSGTLTGSGSYSIGAVFALTEALPASKTIFGNAVYGTSGGGIHTNASGFVETANGTVLQPSGTTLADADNTYGATPEGDLLNNYKSLLVEAAAPVGATPLSWPTLRPYQIAHVHMNVNAGGNQDTYLNGRLVAQTAVGLATNVNPFRIGVNGSAANASSLSVLLAGVYYHSAVVSVPVIFAEIMANKDIAGPVAPNIDYVWSVKQQNFDARSSWVSIGAQPPITMALTGGGTLSPTGNVLSVYDLPVMWA